MPNSRLIRRVFAILFLCACCSYFLSLGDLAIHLYGDVEFVWGVLGFGLIVSMVAGFFIDKKIPNSFLFWGVLIASLMVVSTEYLVVLLMKRSNYSFHLVLSFTFLVGLLLGGMNSQRLSKITDYFIAVVLAVWCSMINNELISVLQSVLMLLGVIGLVNVMSKVKIGMSIFGLIGIIVLFSSLPASTRFKSQAKFEDKVVYEHATILNKLVVTEWMDNFWFYLNGNKQASTRDAFMFYEPMVVPALALQDDPKYILVIGGENGTVINQLVKNDIGSITLLPLDTALISISSGNPYYLKINKRSISNKSVKVVNAISPFHYLNDTNIKYDLIIIDCPDPTTVELNENYTKELYDMAYSVLSDSGMLITQATSPYFTSKAFWAIKHTMESSLFSVLPMHNQIPSIGEWGWMIGFKKGDASEYKVRLLQKDFALYHTQWLNNDAMRLITSFGKDLVSIDELQVNTIQHPTVYKYYNLGNWKFE